jgi:uridine kinase
MGRRMFVVGIGGPSGSGKSTIAVSVAEALNSPFYPVNFDAYFTPEKWPEEEVGDTGVTTRNAELPTGVDFALALRDVQTVQVAVQSGQPIPEADSFGNSIFGMPRWRQRDTSVTPDDDTVVLVLEGYLVFHPPEIAALCDCTIWLDLDLETSLERRYGRDGPAFEERGVDRDGKPACCLPAACLPACLPAANLPCLDLCHTH